MITDLLPKNTIMYWRVRANGGLGASDFSPVFTFTSAAPPTVPTPVSPLNNSTAPTDPPVLDWSDSLGLPAVHHYEVQIATNSTFTTGVAGLLTTNNISRMTPSYTFSNGLAYYWRVRSYAANGHYSNWSATFKFNIVLLAPMSVP
jgi:hypothetical protein